MLMKKIIFILLTFLIALICLTSVNAIELNETNIDNQSMADENNEILSIDNNDEKYSDASSEYSDGSIRCKFSQSGYYYGETKLHVSLINSTDSSAAEGKDVEIYVNNEPWKTFTTNKNGAIDVNFNRLPGHYLLKAVLHDESELNIGSLDVTISKIPTNFALEQKSAYYKDTKLTFKLTNILTGKGVANEKIAVAFSNGKRVTIKTNAKGIGSYDVPFKPGTYSLTASTTSSYIDKNKVVLKNFPVGKTYLRFGVAKLSTTYDSGKTLNIKVTNYFNKHPMKGVKVYLNVYTGKKYKTVCLKTDSNGIARYNPSQLSIGIHKVVIKNGNAYMQGDERTTSINLYKAKLFISAPKIITDKNNTKTFKITVKNKETKRVMKNINVAVKVYTGKKFKIYNLKTNSLGQATLSVSSLSADTHNVIISAKAGLKHYSATARSSITINK